MKRIFKLIHLWLSIPAGVIIVLLCLTGSLLVFQRDINKLVDYNVQNINKEENFHLLSLDTLCKVAFKESKKGYFPSLTVYSDSCKAWNFKPSGHFEKDLWINPYTGEITGRGTSTSSFFTPIRQFHRWLLFSGEGFWARQTGRILVGISTFCLFIIIITGFGIFFPKNKTQWKQVFSIRKGKTSWVWWFTSHRAIGWYCGLFLIAMTVTGPMWSFLWYRSFVYNIFNAKYERSHKATKEKQNAINITTWNEALKSIKEKTPDFVSITLEKNNGTVKLPNYHELASDQFTFNNNGNITSYTSYNDLPNSKKIMGYVYIIHTGDWGGFIIKLLYFLASLGGAFLTISGYWLYWKRLSDK